MTGLNKLIKKEESKMVEFKEIFPTAFSNMAGDKIISSLIYRIGNTTSLPELATRMLLTKDGAWYHLKILKKEGTLKRIGPTKDGSWITNKEPQLKGT